ncbi:MAG TPA: hypothetical protein VL068_00065 [Microthrixaceae bacterium]|nr:hypothetical protein [Microthrixaceae bacterium]
MTDEEPTSPESLDDVSSELPTEGTSDAAHPMSATPQESTWGQGYLNQPPAMPGSNPGGPYGGGASGGGGGSTGAGPSDLPYRPVKLVRGPRFSGTQMIGGLGLIGFLITILIMALMGGKVLDGVSSSGKTQGSVIDPVTQEIEGGKVESNVDSSRIAKCATNQRTVEIAAQAYELATGHPPADQQALVDEGYLREISPGHSIKVENGESVVVPIPPCS